MIHEFRSSGTVLASTLMPATLVEGGSFFASTAGVKAPKAGSTRASTVSRTTGRRAKLRIEDLHGMGGSGGCEGALGMAP